MRKIDRVRKPRFNSTGPILLAINPSGVRFCGSKTAASCVAKIPASFTLQLGKDVSDFGRRRQRKLLNTEKLIFQNNNPDNHGVMYVLVTVIPEGVVDMPNVKEHEFIIFSIVCDELLLGIPSKAWLVGALVILCIALALFVPHYLPPFLLQNKTTHTEQQASKLS